MLGVSPTTITLGEMADVSGPIPGLFAGAAYGTDAWAAYVNSVGGIDGRKIVIDHKDSALSCAAFTNGITSLIGSTFAMVGSASVVDSCGDAALKSHSGFPDVPAFLVSTSYAADPNVFSPVPEPSGWITTGFQWVKDNYGAAAVQHFASLWGSTEQMTYDAQAAAAESVGYKVVYDRGVGYTETNFVSDILRMKSEGIEVVDLTDDAVGQVADFLQEAAQQGYKPKAVITDAGYDSSFFKLLGNQADAAPLVMPLAFALYLGQDDSSVPEITTMTTWEHKTHPGATLNLYVLEAFASGLLLQQALEKVGPHLTQAKLIAALRGITSFDANGLEPHDNPGQGRPPVCAIITEVKNGQFVRVDPPTTGFECNGTYHYYHSS